MKKSFKKVIACMLAVLMITLSMPFSALAKVGDYAPDVQLQFSTFGDGENFGEKAFGPDKAATIKATWSSSVLNSAPVTYDKSTGTLKVTKEDINVMNEVHELDPATEDWSLGVGDAFAVTVRIDNVNEIGAGNINIRFSDNVEPAGFVTTGSGKNTEGLVCTEAGMPAGASVEAGFCAPLEDFSASTLYAGINDALPDQSGIIDDPYAENEDGWNDKMMNANIVCQGDSVDVSALADANAFFDIEKHVYDEESGYNYAGKFIVVSFAFMITGDGPVRFALQDPDGSLDPLLDGAAFFAKKSEGLKTEDATTYAVNNFNRATGKLDGETEWPGSRKMTFMGENDNIVTVTFKAENGDVISTKEYSKGMAVEIPSLPDTAVDDTTHTTYAWDSEPSKTAVENAVYQVTSTTSDHTFDEGIITKYATCTEAGIKKFTCTVCGKEKTEETALAEHTPGEALAEDIVNATCTVDGSYNEVVRCKDCGALINSTPRTIPAPGHKNGQPVEENRVESTCTVAGQYDEVVYCTECKEEISRTQKTLPLAPHVYEAVVTAPTCTEQGYTTYTCKNCTDTYVDNYVPAKGHTPADAVKENVVAATCTKTGSYDEVVYCADCKAEISRTQKTTPMVAHKSVTVKGTPATFTKAGKTDGKKCSVCGKVLTAQKTIAKLGSPALSKVTAGKKQFKATWKSVKSIDGYEIQYATNSKFTKGKKTVKVSGYKSASKTVKSLKAKQKYYVRIRGYKKISGKTQYSSWSKSKTVTTKK